jgi:flavin-dependent dehydrogenase
VVVGSGPAGATTALLLARAGARVLLIDRHTFPRRKACGDCLSPQANRVLGRLGLLDAVLAARPELLEGWRIVAPDRSHFQECFTAVCNGDATVATALSIERTRFDAVLVDAAIDAGARFLHAHVRAVVRGENGMRRVLMDHDRAVDAPLVIGADGLRSVVARSIGAVRRAAGRQKVSLTGHLCGVGGVGPIGEMHVADGLCAGIAPVTCASTPVCNVTLVADARRFGRQVAEGSVAFYWRTLERFGGLCGRFEEARFAGEHGAPLLASGSFHQPTRRVTANGVALVGDAAGYFDPFTGQGIYQALAGAELLAHVAVSALARRDTSARALRAYARAYSRLVGTARLLQRVVDAVLTRPALADVAIRRLAGRPTVARAVLAATGDLRPATTLLSPAAILSFAGPRWIERL